MPSKHVTECSKAIVAKKWTIAFVESATAGRMSAEFSMTDESGEILRGGICCYDVSIKERILGVPHELIEKHTAESAEVTESIAKGALPLFKSDIIAAVTGLTTPGGSESEEKPVGTMFLYIITPYGNINHREVFHGSAETIIIQAIDRAAELTTKKIKQP